MKKCIQTSSPSSRRYRELLEEKDSSLNLFSTTTLLNIGDIPTRAPTLTMNRREEVIRKTKEECISRDVQSHRIYNHTEFGRKDFTDLGTISKKSPITTLYIGKCQCHSISLLVRSVHLRCVRRDKCNVFSSGRRWMTSPSQ